MRILNAARAGEFPHVVTVNKITNVLSADGGWTETPVAVAAGVRARIRPLRGRELFAAQQVKADAEFMITLRYDSRLAAWDSKYQVVWGSRTFEAIGPVRNVEERNITLEMMAKESE